MPGEVEVGSVREPLQVQLERVQLLSKGAEQGVCQTGVEPATVTGHRHPRPQGAITVGREVSAALRAGWLCCWFGFGGSWGTHLRVRRAWKMAEGGPGQEQWKEPLYDSAWQDTLISSSPEAAKG